MKFFAIVLVLTAGLAGLISTLSESSVSAGSPAVGTIAPEESRPIPSTQISPQTTLVSDPPISTLQAQRGASLRVPDNDLAPVRIRIERLGIDLDIASVGVDDRGDFDVPSSGIGWYHHGSVPGESGSAVVAAHVDYAGAPGAFFLLETLVPGDMIEIDRSDGTTQTFEVTEQVLYDKTALPADELFARNGDAALRLITCGGEFDHEARSYRGNRVVTARPLNPALG